MGWFSGQSKAAKELERKRQQEKDEENAKKADDVCEEQKTPYHGVSCDLTGADHAG